MNITSSNVIFSLSQVVVSGIILLIIYRFLIDSIGVSQLGVWSIVLASTSIAKISEFGLGSSMVKFVAKYKSSGCAERADDIVETTLLSIALILGFFLFVGYPLIGWLLTKIIPAESISEGLTILPYALFSLWLSALTGAIHSALDGCQRVDLRSKIIIFSQVVYASLVFLSVPNYGLVGLALSQTIQAFLTVLLSWVVLRNQMCSLPMLPFRWTRACFREVIGYGSNLQFISVASMLFDPATKALLSKFGGLSFVGYYEMSSRLILQFRLLLVSANQAVLPLIANTYELNPSKVNYLYKKVYDKILFFSLPITLIIIALLPTFGELWIGHYEYFFVYSGALLSLSWTINSLCAPAYFSYLGMGRLRWNVLAHVIIALVNVGLGVALGMYFGAEGVIVAFCVALLLGSMTSIVAYHLENKISLLVLWSRNATKIILSGSLGLVIVYLIYFGGFLKEEIALQLIISGFIMSLFLLPVLWFDPLRGEILEVFRKTRK